MNQRTRTIWAGTVVTSCVVLALILPALLRGEDPARGESRSRLVVHEWGTFTSFAGSDGANLEFRPLASNDLPHFVIRPWSNAGNIFAKKRFTALQRMETPVTYFYTDVPRTVNVRVDFPLGMLTDWYPLVKAFDAGEANATRPQGQAFLNWGPVRLTPPAQFAQVKLRGPKGTHIPATLPAVADDDHYGQARDTDSAIVEVLDPEKNSHFEKFLFYRGLGNFGLPLKLVALGEDRFEVSNSAEEASGALLLVRIENGQIRFVRLAAVPAHGMIETTLPHDESTVDELAAATVTALTETGLYEKESLAMVNTWRTSWFGENGTRLLYLLPETQTEEILPLTIEPAPDESVRVLVGRLETLTPEDCQRIARAFEAVSDEELTPLPAALQAEVDALGRFAEPALKFVAEQTSDESVRSRIQAFLAVLRNPK